MDSVARPRVFKQRIELRAVAVLAAGLIREHAVEGDPGQLSGGGLVDGADADIAEVLSAYNGRPYQDRMPNSQAKVSERSRMGH